jgi:hypothetical protein
MPGLIYSIEMLGCRKAMYKEFFTFNYLSNLPCSKDCLAGKKCAEMFNNAICFRPIFDHVRAAEKATGEVLILDNSIKDSLVYKSSNQSVKVTIVKGSFKMEHKSAICFLPIISLKFLSPNALKNLISAS